MIVDAIADARIDAGVTVPGRFTLRVERDLRGQWVSAATTAGYYIVDFEVPDVGTSEISEPRLVE